MGFWQGLGSTVSTITTDAGHLMVGTDLFDTLMAGVASASFFQVFNLTENFVY